MRLGNPHKNIISKHIVMLSKNLNLYSSDYENNITIANFNVGVSDLLMNDFCNAYNLSSLNKEPTCYKNPKNPKSHCSFEGFCVVETCLSDFHGMVVTIIKITFQRLSDFLLK